MKQSFREDLAKRSREFLGLYLNNEQLDAFQNYYDLLLEWNKVMNLTAITESSEVVDKHMIDSFLFAPFIPQESSLELIDIGSGAGFPGIPLAILRPDLSVTCLDSLKKRVNFLENVIQACGLKNVRAIHGRTEDLAKDPSHRDHYDLATARAVAKLPVLLEFAMPLVKPGGLLIAGKGPDLAQEMQESGAAAKALKTTLFTTAESRLPEGDARFFAIYKKIGLTPNRFPRKAGDAKRNPILS